MSINITRPFPFRSVPSTTFLEVFPVASSRTIDGGRWGGCPPTAPADRQRGSMTKGREPASAPKVLFVYKDVLMKCIGSLLIWKLGEGVSRTCL